MNDDDDDEDIVNEGCANILVRESTCLVKQEAQLSPRDRAMRRVS